MDSSQDAAAASAAAALADIRAALTRVRDGARSPRSQYTCWRGRPDLLEADRRLLRALRIERGLTIAEVQSAATAARGFAWRSGLPRSLARRWKPLPQVRYMRVDGCPWCRDSLRACELHRPRCACVRCGSVVKKFTYRNICSVCYKLLPADVARQYPALRVPRSSDDTFDEWLELRELGWNRRSAAARLGMTPNALTLTIKRVARRRGIEPPMELKPPPEVVAARKRWQRS